MKILQQQTICHNAKESPKLFIRQNQQQATTSTQDVKNLKLINLGSCIMLGHKCMEKRKYNIYTSSEVHPSSIQKVQHVKPETYLNHYRNLREIGQE